DPNPGASMSRLAAAGRSVLARYPFPKPWRRQFFRRPAVLRVEPLEARDLPAVQPLTLADPRYWGATANGNSGSPALSPDGQLIAFTSVATNLAPNSTSPAPGTTSAVVPEVFVRNLSTGQNNLVSVNGDGTGGGNNRSFSPVFSGDGRSVAFLSQATDLTALSTDNRR